MRHRLAQAIVVCTLAFFARPGRCDTAPQAEVLTDKDSILSVRNPPVTNIGRKIDKESGFLGISDDFGNLVRVELQMLGKEIIDKKMKEGGERALLDCWFDSGYFPRTYGLTRPPSTLLSREYMEVDSRAVLFLSVSVPKGSVLTVDGEPMDSKRFIAAYMVTNCCVMATFEARSLDAKQLSAAEEAKSARQKMVELIRSIDVDRNRLPREQ